MSLTRFPSYYRHMHEHKSKCDSFGDFMGQNMIKGPLACLKLLLIRSSEALILLLLLELRIVYRIAHAHTNKQVQTIRNSTANNINSTKRGY